MKLHVEIEDHDIQLGICADARNCAGARATDRALVDAGLRAYSEVYFDHVDLYGSAGSHDHVRLRAPDKLSDFIDEYDDWGSCDRDGDLTPQATEFDLDIPDDFVERCKAAQEKTNASS